MIDHFPFLLGLPFGAVFLGADGVSRFGFLGAVFALAAAAGCFFRTVLKATYNSSG